MSKVGYKLSYILFSTHRHESVRRLPGKPETFVILTLDEDKRQG